MFCRLGQSSLVVTLENTDVVVHAAARAHIIRDEVGDALEKYRKINRDATMALARLAAEAGVKRFVFEFNWSKWQSKYQTIFRIG